MFKIWCKGYKSNTENSTDHFCKETTQNALAALINLGHMTTTKPTLGVICHSMANTCCVECTYQSLTIILMVGEGYFLPLTVWEC